MDLAVILEALRSCGVDTAEEQLLLRQRAGAAEHPVLLVAGDEPGRPLDLLEGLGIPPVAPDGRPFSFPVQCVYGEQFQLTADDVSGEKHHYYDMDSFRTHCKVEIASLSVTADAPVLRVADLRFITVNEGTVSRLPELAGDCSGVLLVLDSTAGAPEPAVGALCQWLKGTSGMEEKICLLLNHTEKAATNWMLETTLDVESLDTLSCDYQVQAGSEDSPGGVLAAAAEILSGTAAGGVDGLVAQCVERAGRKLEARIGELERTAGEKDAAARWFFDNSRDYRAKMQMAGAAMDLSLTPSQKEDLEADIKGLKEQLARELPGMCAELVERSGKQAKEDMKNLAGAYVGALCESYMEFVTQQIAGRILLPQAKKAFRAADDEYRSLVDQAPIPVNEWTGGQDTELLRSMQFNLGDYQDPIARAVSMVVGFFFKTGAKVAARVAFEELGFILYDPIDSLASVLEKGTETFVERIQSVQGYVDRCRKRLEKMLDSAPDMMFRTLDGTVLPRIKEDTANLFRERINSCCALLEKQGSVQKQEAEAIRAQRTALEEKRRSLAALV